MNNPFPQSKEYEDELLSQKDRSDLRAYMSAYIDKALNDKPLAESERLQLRSELIAAIDVAADRFVLNKNDREREYKFSAYFSWHIAQALNGGKS